MTSIYSYTARNGDGAFVAGSLQAESREHALAHLRVRTLYVTSIAPADSASGMIGSLVTGWPISSAARTTFFRSFATLIRSGVPIQRALDVVVESCRDARLREALRSVSSDIESGSGLSTAMSRRPREFPMLYVAMVRAGELGGALDVILERLATLLERHLALRKKIQAALAYPLIVALAAAGLVLFLVGSTVPAFASMFAEMRVTLPWSTRMLIALGNALKNPLLWLVIAAIPPLVAASIGVGRRSERIATRIDQLALGAPVFGAILHKAVVARFSRTLGTLLRSGVPLLDALDAANGVVENAVYSRLTRDLAGALREGSSIAPFLEQSALFDALFLQLVRVGEETGTLDAMLLRIAEYYELDVETAVATLGSVVEPILIIALGGLVGLIVGSILIPLYSMIGSIK
ncbi:MAG TPA: type II secretion system F family protein [Alphaproteobacteria bacterium]|nr:type II secretion system F family protein [Alphaproteobacteria bacterium]